MLPGLAMIGWEIGIDDDAERINMSTISLKNNNKNV